MTSSVTEARPADRWLSGMGVVREDGWTAPDARRKLQLLLAGIWLLDAILQFQAFMFSKGFAQMLGATGPGNPGVIAGPISWAARIIAQHGIVTNAIFAAIQLLIALGIAFRPTLRLALGVSIAWALAVWWLGEGLGGVLSGVASPVNGAPGAVILYALLAVLLWPPRRGRPASFAAAGAVGPAVARALWLVLWGSLAYLSVTPATRARGAMSGMISAMASGEPAWLARTDQHLAVFLASRGGVAGIVLAVVLAVVAAGIYLPPRARRAVLVLAILTAAAIWLAEGLGGMLTGAGTDPNSGLLLALVALAFWPLAARPDLAARPSLAESDLAESEPAESDLAESDLAESEPA
jgi:hypothetical protein